MIPFNRPYDLYNTLCDPTEGFRKIVEDRYYTKGQWVKGFERAIANKMDIPDWGVITFGSGTTAIYGALYGARKAIFKRHLNLTYPAFSWKSIIEPIKANCDVSRAEDVYEDTWHMDTDYFDGHIAMPMDTFGSRVVTDLNPDTVIYDAAQSFGAGYHKGRLPSPRGLAECYSFSGSKIFTTGGEGGMVVTTDKRLAESVKNFRNIFCKMTEAQALVGLMMLNNLDNILYHKKQMSIYYKTNIKMKKIVWQIIPDETNNYITAFRTPIRDRIIREAAGKIAFRDFYREPLAHKPVTDVLSHEMLCLPMGSMQDVIQVTDWLNERYA